MTGAYIGWVCLACGTACNPRASDCPHCGVSRWGQMGWLCPTCGVSNNPANETCANAWGDGLRHSIPIALREFVMERDAGICQECGSVERPTLDHVHPVILGGMNHPNNLRVLCQPCNSSKGARV